LVTFEEANDDKKVTTTTTTTTATTHEKKSINKENIKQALRLIMVHTQLHSSLRTLLRHQGHY